MQPDQEFELKGFAQAGVLLPKELFIQYLSDIGLDGLGLWALLNWAKNVEGRVSLRTLALKTGLGSEELQTLFNRLIELRLLAVDNDGLEIMFPFGGKPAKQSIEAVGGRETPKSKVPGAAGEKDEIHARAKAKSAPPHDIEADMQAVLDIYHKRVGMIGPSQLDKLRFWVETKEMSAEVVAVAIEEMLKNAKTPRIEYLEGILRNWYNDGIRNLGDLLEKHNMDESQAKTQLPVEEKGYEGVPNAGAYYENKDLVRKWRELYGSSGG